jgi:hypothetical protein
LISGHSSMPPLWAGNRLAQSCRYLRYFSGKFLPRSFAWAGCRATIFVGRVTWEFENMECDWDEDTLISFTEDDTIFGPQGVYGWLMNLWCRFVA